MAGMDKAPSTPPGVDDDLDDDGDDDGDDDNDDDGDDGDGAFFWGLTMVMIGRGQYETKDVFG